MMLGELSRCKFYICSTISIPLVNAAVKHSASQKTRSSNKDSTPLGSVPPPPTPLKAKGKEDKGKEVKGKEDSKQIPVVFMKLLASEEGHKFIRPQTDKRDRCTGSSSHTLSSVKKREKAKKSVKFYDQNTSVIYGCYVMVDDISYGDWLIQQGSAKPISTPTENDTENPN